MGIPVHGERNMPARNMSFADYLVREGYVFKRHITLRGMRWHWTRNNKPASTSVLNALHDLYSDEILLNGIRAIR